MRRLSLFLLLLSSALWFGSSVYFVFAANELFGQLGTDAGGAAVGALFPSYFAISAILSIVTLLLFMWVGGTWGFSRRAHWTGTVLSIVGVVFAVLNRVYMLPHIERVERQMGPISKASAAMLQQFGMWHGISMLFDFIMIVCTFAVIAVLSFALGRK